ncbi:MAG: Ppx/GppA family phosphatase [Nitrospinota bacterium]
MHSPPSRTPGRPLAAVVDLGTNAARLAMASLGPSGELVPEGRWRELIRLGEGVVRTGVLSAEAMERGAATLRRFAALIAGRKVDTLDAVGTSALREAANREEFLARAREAGIPLRVIPAAEEARLALAGVWAGLVPPPERALVFDIGGGSLELILGEGGRIRGDASLRAGVVYLTERHLRDMPTPPDQVEACARAVREMLREVRLDPRRPEGTPLVGCGGVVALAGFIGAGRPGGIQGRMLRLGEFEGWLPRFAGLDFAGRRALPGFEPGREDVALAGLIVALEVLRWAGREAFQVSTGGVREGRLRELLIGIT